MSTSIKGHPNAVKMTSIANPPNTLPTDFIITRTRGYEAHTKSTQNNGDGAFSQALIERWPDDSKQWVTLTLEKSPN